MNDQPIQAEIMETSQPSAMPTDQVAPEVQQPTEAPNQTTDVSTQPQDELALPDGVKDRTAEQFEKLKQQLAEERTRRMEVEQYYNSLSQTSAPVNPYLQPQVPTEAPIYNPETGEVNIQSLEEMRRKTAEAELAAKRTQEQFQKYLEKQQEAEAYSVHPDIDPKSREFDQDKYKITRAILADSMFNPKDYGGQELTLKQAADLAARQQAKQIEQVKKEVAQQVVEQVTPKEQASLEAIGRSDARVSVQDHQSLSLRTRTGDWDAIAARMKGIPSV